MDPPVQAWQIIPVRMRVYPSSGFKRERRRPILEVRVELFDDVGDSVKGVGVWRFELYARTRGRHSSGPLLYTWDVPMMTIEQNRRFYDPITRTFEFRLKLDDESTARQATVLHVIFTGPDGKILEAQSDLEFESRAAPASLESTP